MSRDVDRPRCTAGDGEDPLPIPLLSLSSPLPIAGSHPLQILQPSRERGVDSGTVNGNPGSGDAKLQTLSCRAAPRHADPEPDPPVLPGAECCPDSPDNPPGDSGESQTPSSSTECGNPVPAAGTEDKDLDPGTLEGGSSACGTPVDPVRNERSHPECRTRSRHVHRDQGSCFGSRTRAVVIPGAGSGWISVGRRSHCRSLPPSLRRLWARNLGRWRVLTGGRREDW